MTQAIGHSSSGLWRNKGHAYQIHHLTNHQWLVSSTNHQGCHLLGSGLFVDQQCHYWATNA